MTHLQKSSLAHQPARDMQAYFVQCNDRQHGGGCISALLKESCRRDRLGVKGGITDYCRIGEIDVQVLRKFYSSHSSLENLFKQ